MTETEQKPSQPEEGIEQSIELWKNSIVIFAVLLLGALIGYFWFYVKHLPTDPTATDRLGIGDWGAFGDFMGGLMNPIVAFAALYWLTQSVKLQKKELELARKAAEESSIALQQQVLVSRESVNIAAVTALLNIHQQQIEGRQHQINGVNAQQESGQYTEAQQIALQKALFKQLVQERDKLISEREEYKTLLLSKLSDKVVEK